MSPRAVGAVALLAILMLVMFPASRASADPGELAGGGQKLGPDVSAQESAAHNPKPKQIIITLSADINLSTQRLTVSSGGTVLHVWPISSGTRGYETPRGTFRPQWAARTWFSRKYDNAPMPYSVFFNGGIATHGTHAVGRLGRPASHGCVRLTTHAAATFYALVHKHGYAATRIVVHGTPRAHEVVAGRQQRAPDGRQRTVARSYGEPREVSWSHQAYAYPGFGDAQPGRTLQRPGYRHVRYLQPAYGRY